MGQLTASYDAGTAGAPLVGDTIGVALAKMVVAQPDVEALVSRHQGVRLSYSELGAQVEQVARGLLAVGIETGDRVGIWSPTCVEWTLAAVRVRPGRRDPRQREPGLPAERARLRAPPLRRAAARHRAFVQDVRLPRDARRCARRAPPAREGRHDRRRVSRRRRRTSTGPRWSSSATASPADQVALSRAAARHRRPDQHPVHERHDRQPQGRHAHAPQHPEQRPGDGRGTWATRRSTACASQCRCTTASAWGSATWAASRRDRRWCTPPQASIRWRRSRRSPRSGARAVYGVPTMFIAMLEHPRFARVRHVRRCGPGSWRARRARSR